MTGHGSGAGAERRRYIACLHDQNKSVFLEGGLFSSQSGLIENISDYFDWLNKSRPFKKVTFVLIM